jgi:hypothetical protein
MLFTKNETLFGVCALALICAERPVRQADFSPQVRRQSFSAPNASSEGASRDAGLYRSTRKG